MSSVVVAGQGRWSGLGSLRARLAAGFGLLGLILAATVGSSLWGLTQLAGDAHHMVEVSVPSANATGDMVSGINASLAAVRGWLLTGEARFKVERAKAAADLDALRAELDRLAQGWTDRADRERWVRLKSILGAFRSALEEVERAGSGPDKEPANRLLLEQATPRADELLEILLGAPTVAGERAGGLDTSQYRRLDADDDAIAQQIRQLRVVNGVLLGLGLTIAAGVAILAIRATVRPLSGMCEALARMERDERVAVPGLGRRDEVGTLATALASFQDRALAAARLKAALDNAESKLMVADAEHTIVYVNKELQKMLEEAEADVRRDLPQFDARRLLGTSIDAFHKNPAHQRGILVNLSSTHRVQIEVGGRTFRLAASPVIDVAGRSVRRTPQRCES